MRRGAPRTRATAPSAPAAPPGASATSCFRSGRKVPNGELSRHVQVRGWIPLDDEHTMYCVLWWKRGVSLLTQQAPAFKDGAPIGGMGRYSDFLPNTTDWLGRWRLAANASNDWHIDRAAQHDNVIYSGIDTIHLQDQAVTESMGVILDHAFEHLASSDQCRAAASRQLLARACLLVASARAFAKRVRVFDTRVGGAPLALRRTAAGARQQQRLGACARSIRSDEARCSKA